MLRKKYAENLVAYDYGTGAVWAVVISPDKEEITKKYPVLRVISEIPAWMGQVEYDELERIDLYSEPPSWLAIALNADHPS